MNSALFRALLFMLYEYLYVNRLLSCELAVMAVLSVLGMAFKLLHLYAGFVPPLMLALAVLFLPVTLYRILAVNTWQAKWLDPALRIELNNMLVQTLICNVLIIALANGLVMDLYAHTCGLHMIGYAGLFVIFLRFGMRLGSFIFKHK